MRGVSELVNRGADTRSRFSTKKVSKFIFTSELGKCSPFGGAKAEPSEFRGGGEIITQMYFHHMVSRLVHFHHKVSSYGVQGTEPSGR